MAVWWQYGIYVVAYFEGWHILRKCPVIFGDGGQSKSLWEEHFFEMLSEYFEEMPLIWGEGGRALGGRAVSLRRFLF